MSVVLLFAKVEKSLLDKICNNTERSDFQKEYAMYFRYVQRILNVGDPKKCNSKRSVSVYCSAVALQMECLCRCASGIHVGSQERGVRRRMGKNFRRFFRYGQKLHRGAVLQCMHLVILVQRLSVTILQLQAEEISDTIL